jgi:hypothetical protein
VASIRWLGLCRLAVLVTALAGYATAEAAQSTTTFGVSVRVLARATLNVSSQPPDVVISQADVQRGFVDVAEPMHLEISTNDPTGYVLLVLPQSPWFSQVTVRSAGGEVTLGNEGGTVVERGRTAPTTSLELTWRFALAPDMVPGRYPWPLHLAVQPLQAS